MKELMKLRVDPEAALGIVKHVQRQEPPPPHQVIVRQAVPGGQLVDLSQGVDAMEPITPKIVGAGKFLR